MPTSAAAQLGLQLAGQVAGAGMGMILGGVNDRRQIEQQRKLQELQIAGQKEMSSYNFARQKQMWEETNYPAQVAQMKKAGINPGLIYGMSGGGGTTTGSQGGNVSGATAPQGGGEIQAMAGMGLQNALQAQLIAAQTENIKAQTEKTKVDTQKTAGPDTANIQADTENKILNKIILEYTGKEAKDTYERVMKPNRAIQSETHMATMEAQQAITKTIYELWKNGQLENKANAEIEQILLQNAKTREEIKNIIKTWDLLEENIKGAKLENIMKELESKLQTETGIDKNSPAWMKILGRLFIGLTGQ